MEGSPIAAQYDGAADGVYTALTTSAVLLYNSNDGDVHRVIDGVPVAVLGHAFVSVPRTAGPHAYTPVKRTWHMSAEAGVLHSYSLRNDGTRTWATTNLVFKLGYHAIDEGGTALQQYRLAAVTEPIAPGQIASFSAPVPAMVTADLGRGATGCAMTWWPRGRLGFGAKVHGRRHDGSSSRVSQRSCAMQILTADCTAGRATERHGANRGR